ncbi:MAG: ATP-dependent helicase [Candidatus Aminicenantales bacterium]
MNDDFLSGLTERQRAAASHWEGPMLVLAGPGSGKTRVITHRIAHLISRGVSPRAILALTFTNKAAEEMRTRLLAMKIPGGATLCTFHSLCARLLREHADRAGLPEAFSIYDQSDQKAVINEILKERNLDPKEYAPARVLRRIGLKKNLGLETDKPSARPFFEDSGDPLLDEIAEAYAKRLAAAGALDFDDLLTKTAGLLKNDAELRETLGRRYGFILVDEYQDTNACQYRIARALAQAHGNLFVTGDPDQSIYGWRGADIENILAFEKDYPGAPVVRLEENFRSTPQVLSLADDLIRKNARRKEKRLIPRKPGGSLPRLYHFADEREEARGVAAWARWMREDHGIEYGRMAVFYRTNAMSRLVEEALIQAGIPYQIVKGLEFFKRREIKDMLAYLRLLINPADEVSLLRVVNRPARGIGETTIRKTALQARSAGRDIWSVLKTPAEVPDISAAAVPRIGQFVGLIEDLRSGTGGPVAGIIKDVYSRSGLRKALEDEEDADAAENIEELIHSALQFDQGEQAASGLAGYLQQTSLISDADAYREGSGAVSLMTLHTAKGLEFAAVMIVGVEEGIIPHCRSFEGGRDVEEERRLLFVGITRAEKHLALSCAQTRTMHGQTRPAALSPFLKGLDGIEMIFAPFLTNGFGGSAMSKRAAGGSASLPARERTAGAGSVDLPDQGRDRPGVFNKHAFARAAEPAAENGSGFREGQRVRHPALGTGRIEKLIPGGEKGRAVVQFDTGARLTMDLGIAKLEPSAI